MGSLIAFVHFAFRNDSEASGNWWRASEHEVALRAFEKGTIYEHQGQGQRSRLLCCLILLHQQGMSLYDSFDKVWYDLLSNGVMNKAMKQ